MVIQMKQSNYMTMKLTQAALMAALCYIGFQFFRFDIPVGMEKTAFHFGNVFLVLGVLLLGGVWGGLSGAVGMTIADLTSGYVTSAPKTFFLKLCIGLIVGFVAYRIGKINQTSSKTHIVKWAAISSICGMGFNVFADPIVGYFYKMYLLGIPQDAASVWAKIGALTTFVNAVIAVIVSTILYCAIRPAFIKSGILPTVK